MYITEEKLSYYLNIEDLTNNDGHAINIVLNKIIDVLETNMGLEATVVRTSPIVKSQDNYDNLYYPDDTVTRNSRYSHYVDESHLLRTHMTASIPPILETIDGESLIVCPGLVYRRDVVDSTHVGEPHQVDLWVVKKKRVGRSDLVKMIEMIIDAVLPGCEYRLNETYHYYTINGLEVEVNIDGKWIELLECGEIHPWLIQDSGLSNEYSGLAMGIGLDRLVMMIKRIKDIRLL